MQRNTTQIERAVLLQALERAGGNKAKAARMLDIDYKTIHTKLRQYGIRSAGKDDTYPTSPVGFNRYTVVEHPSEAQEKGLSSNVFPR